MVAYGVGEINTDRETISLGQLQGAVLKYQDENGNTVEVPFDE